MSVASNIRTPYRPRYALSYRTRTKVWPNKNSRLRRLVSLRGRRLQRGGLFRRYVLVATTIKWTEARRQIRPVIRRGGAARTGGRVAFGRPRRRRYRDSAAAAQQVRSFAGKRSARALRQLVRRGVGGGRGGAGVGSTSFFAALASRLDMVLFRRRLRPTVVAAHQFIHHQGIAVNGRLAFSPRRLLQPGDTVSIRPDTFTSSERANRRLRRWRTILWDLFCRVYYRRWGLYTLRRRLLTIGKKIGRRYAIRRGSVGRTAYFRARLAKAALRPAVAGLGFNASQNVKRAMGLLENGTVSMTPAARLLLRLRLALRLRKSFLPRTRSSLRRRVTVSSPRTRRIRLLVARRAKAERRRKIIRLRPVHRRIPTYIHRDFRTLRAVRLHQPAPEESVFPFRATLTQVATFFRARGI